jgi:hypothetical protein
MILYLRHRYRKLLLFFLPARSYVLECQIPQEQVIERLQSLVQPDKLYFIFPAKTEKPYSGKFGTNRFVAIKSSKKTFQRQIKVRGNFYLMNGKIFVRLILSNPFSIINFIVLGALYFSLLIFQVWIFDWWLWNLLLMTVPIIITYLFTNFSFQAVYRKEKQRFFKLFNSRRLSDRELEKLGV